MIVLDKFAAHGLYEINETSDYLTVEASGTWNAETISQVIIDLLDTARMKALRNWALLVDLTHFELGTPEFQKLGKQGHMELIRAGLTNVAYVNTSNETTKIYQIANMQPGINRYFWRVFATTDEADNWLKSKF